MCRTGKKNRKNNVTGSTTQPSFQLRQSLDRGLVKYKYRWYDITIPVFTVLHPPPQKKKSIIQYLDWHDYCSIAQNVIDKHWLSSIGNPSKSRFGSLCPYLSYFNEVKTCAGQLTFQLTTLTTFVMWPNALFVWKQRLYGIGRNLSIV